MTQNQQPARIGPELARGLAIFWSAALGAVFDTGAASQLVGYIAAKSEVVAQKTVTVFWKLAPTIGAGGMKVADFLDETG